MSCISTEGKYPRHLFTVRAESGRLHRSPTCLRCGMPRRKRPPAKRRGKR